MRVLFVTPEIKNGGIATYCQKLWPELEKRGVEIVVATSEKVTSEEKANFPFQILTPSELTKRNGNGEFDILQLFPLLKESLANAWALFDGIIDQVKPDLVEVAEYPFLFLPWILSQSQVPVLVQLHGSLGQLEMYEGRYGQEVQTTLLRHIEYLAIRNAEGVAALSTSNARFWERSLSREVALLYPNFAGIPAPNKHNNLFGGIVLGRVQTWKGPEELCQAAAVLGDNCPPIEWIGGDNYYKDYSVSMSGHLKSKYPAWGSKIIHTGRIPYAEAQQKLASAKFLIVPSLWDTFNFTVVEGMAQGKVVICSDGAGASEHIIDGENGFVYPAKDIQALAEKIHHADQLSDEERTRIGANAREIVERVFASEEPVNRRITLYKALIEKGPQQKNDPELKWLREWLSSEDQAMQGFPEVLLDQLQLKWYGKYLWKRIRKNLHGKAKSSILGKTK